MCVTGFPAPVVPSPKLQPNWSGGVPQEVAVKVTVWPIVGDAGDELKEQGTCSSAQTFRTPAKAAPVIDNRIIAREISFKRKVEPFHAGLLLLRDFTLSRSGWTIA